ncbi:MAG: glycosyltransferase family 2 protein, partial [Pseudomonadota bacterium]
LNIMRAVILDIPMDAKYGDEKSNLVISKVIGDFLCKHIKNFLKRIFYNYFLRDMSLASIELVFGVILLLFGFTFGGYHWLNTLFSGVVNTAGTVMIAAISLIAGLQFILAFLAYDIASVPKYPLSKILES